MLCVGIAEVAARYACCGASAVKLVACILRAFIKSGGNAGAGGIGAFRVAVMFVIYLPDFFNPRMLVSAGYGCNRDGNIAI